MKKFKKLSALLLAAIMVLTMAMPVMAEDDHNKGINRSQNRAALEIGGLNGGETVTLYQLMTATYYTDGTAVQSYNLNAKLADGGETVVIVPAEGENPAVTCTVAELPVGANGKIDASQKVKIGGVEYTIPTDVATAYGNKWPFTVSAPTESQILAIAAHISDIATAKTVEGDVTVGTHWTVEAYAKESKADGDLTPAIYNATGIYLAHITPAAGDDTLYNPVIVSVGYEHNDSNAIVFKTEGIDDISTAKYAATTSTPKKQNPELDKTVEGGITEKVARPIVKTDANGDPVDNTGKLVDPAGPLWYIKTMGKDAVTRPATQEDVDNSLAQFVGQEITIPAVAEVLTTNAEEALTDAKQDVNSGAVGTVFTYKLTPTIPDYPEGAVNKTLWFSDKLSSGLTYEKGSLEVAITGETVTKTYSNGTYVFKIGDAKIADAKDNEDGFNINFIYDNLPGDTVKTAPVMTYKGVLNNEAICGVNGNPNIATMIYSNQPDKGSTHTTLEKPTGEYLKVIEDYEIVYTYEIYFHKVDENGESLKNAVFGLYAAEVIKNDANEVLYAADELICTIKTNDAGIGYTTEVGPGNYYLKEIEAPQGYSLNTQKYPVEAKWTTATKKTTRTVSNWVYTVTITAAWDYNADATPKAQQVGWLVGEGADAVFYEMNAFDAADETNKIFPAYIKEKVTTTTHDKVTTTNPDVNYGRVTISSDIPNTKTPELPSTGGMGTYLFTIAGVAILGVAAFMLIVKRRRA